MTHTDLVDVLRLHLGLDDQLVGRRHDQHDRLARRDDTADRVYVELMHHPTLRRTDVDALELVFGGDLLFNQFGGLAANVREVLADLGAHVLIDLQDLDLGLGDLALGLRDRGHELPALAFEARLLAFERRHPGELDELLGP